ncbi:nicotinamide-nucleotide adenylyltransferase [Geosmithia morbida]|uniref:Nicotinamide-nucleotide adenylyltransferase n=1 Tax=Geosmithia morbida TaxID=1094350 RepID=A0A9P5D2G7_9HYPO|nr:nicotinamide-nucleotide adenylyltransferase [Geosmithia morbida]KAF4119494.1 nicotinamide-nucleotide adenylyltransferase [Geosmithia morbida]
MSRDPRLLADYFSRSLTSFTSSGEQFRVLCTLLPRNGNGAAQDEDDYIPKVLQPQQSVQDVIVLDSSFNPPTTAHAAMARSAAAAAASAAAASQHIHQTSRTRILLLLAVENADKAPRPASFPLRLCMMEGFGRELLASVRTDAPSTGLEAVDVGVTSRPFFHQKALAIAASGFYRGGTTSASPSWSPGPGPSRGGTEGESGCEMTFLAGYDTLVRIFNPRYYAGTGGMRAALDPFFRSARLRVTMRTDGEWGGREEQSMYLGRLGRSSSPSPSSVAGEADGADGGETDGIEEDWVRRVEMVDGIGGSVSSSRVRQAVEVQGDVDGLVDGEVRMWIEREGLYR